MKLNHKFALLLAGAVLAGSLTGCGASGAPASSAASSEAAASSAVSEAASVSAESALPDGVYTAEFDTDSSMFHANEANDGKGTLTVKDGQMTFHVSLVSKKIVNLYVGMAADAEAHEGDWLQPTTDTVTYSDGLSCMASTSRWRLWTRTSSWPSSAPRASGTTIPSVSPTPSLLRRKHLPTAPTPVT